jgi:hypothetical protein
MHFDVPKPLHGWRAFVGEVGIIVIGVLIALGAEQMVNNLHWRGEVRDADRRLHDDVVANLTNAYERFAIDPCLRPRLGELRDSLLSDQSIWAGSRARFANDVYKSGFPSVYRTPGRPWIQESWHTALNGEVLSHFPPARVRQFALIFDDVDGLQRMQTEEVEASANLGDLAFAGPITAAERRSDLKLVAKLDAIDAHILFQAQVLLRDARQAGIVPNPRDVREALAQQRSYRGPCVRALP